MVGDPLPSRTDLAAMCNSRFGKAAVSEWLLDIGKGHAHCNGGGAAPCYTDNSIDFPDSSCWWTAKGNEQGPCVIRIFVR